MLNSTNVKKCQPDKYFSRGTDIPPSAGIPWIQVDEGNAGPRFMRGTVIQAPQESSFPSQTCIPFGFLVQPLAEPTQYDYQYSETQGEIPYIDYGEEGPFRCSRCKAYVNPYFAFKDGGLTAECNLCNFLNQVPTTYQSALNEFG